MSVYSRRIVKGRMFVISFITPKFGVNLNLSMYDICTLRAQNIRH